MDDAALVAALDEKGHRDLAHGMGIENEKARRFFWGACAGERVEIRAARGECDTEGFWCAADVGRVEGDSAERVQRRQASAGSGKGLPSEKAVSAAPTQAGA